MISGGRIWLHDSKVRSPARKNVHYSQPRRESEPTQHEHMAETTTTEPGGITPAQARAV